MKKLVDNILDFLHKIFGWDISDRKQILIRIGVLIIVYLVFVFIATYKDRPRHIDIPTTIADRNIRAEENIDWIDEEGSKLKLEEALETLPVVIRVDTSLLSMEDGPSVRAERFFNYIQMITTNSTQPRWQKISLMTGRNYGIKLSQRNAEILLDSYQKNSIRDKVTYLLDLIYRRGLYDPSVAKFETERLENGFYKYLVEPDGKGQLYTTIEFSLSELIIMSNMDLTVIAKDNFPGLRTDKYSMIADILDDLLMPNVVFDELRTRTIRDTEIKNSDKYLVRVRIAKGEMIAAEGDPITPEILQKLRAYQAYNREWQIGRLFGNIAIITLMFILGILYFSFFQKQMLHKFKVYLMLMISIAMVMGVIGVIAMIPLGSLPSRMIYIPTIILVILLTTILNTEVVAGIAVFISLFSGLVIREDFVNIFFPVLNAMAAVAVLKLFPGRSKFWLQSLVLGAWNVLLVVIMGISGKYSQVQWAAALSAGAANGVLSVVLAIGLLPFFETVMNIATDHRLMELADLNLPIFQEMLVHAPGTYHHSILVSSLAEAGAAEVGANPILAKVGALYHDIGKIQRPEYFVENQKAGHNPHDRLTPEASAKIIKEHVSNGVERALQLKLPSEIRDIIAQHHSDSAIQYFLDQAKRKKGSKKKFREAAFHYSGSKPATKEAAIVMLADCVEAATRALENPTEVAIRARVKRIIEQRENEGHLAHTPLSLKDLSTLESLFSRMLVGIYHSRIEYNTGDAAKDSKPAPKKTVSRKKKK